MSVFKSQFTRALDIAIPSQNANIPSPYVIVASSTTNGATNQLIDSGVDFITLNVQAGDVVYSILTNQAATVVGVIDANTLELNADIIRSGDLYRLYQASSQTGLGNQGAYLITTEDCDVEVVTIGGDIVSLPCARGIVLPVQVLKLLSISSGIAKALW